MRRWDVAAADRESRSIDVPVILWFALNPLDIQGALQPLRCELASMRPTGPVNRTYRQGHRVIMCESQLCRGMGDMFDHRSVSCAD